MSKGMNRAVSYLLGMMLVSGALLADEEMGNIPVGSRQVTHAERVRQQEERAERAADKSDCEKGNCPAAIPAKTYYSSHQGAFHNPLVVGYYGETAELEDGSIWTVAPSDRYKTLDWLTADVIMITQNTSWFSSYHYVLVNMNTGARVEVNLTLGPIYNGFYTHYITVIDQIAGQICLEDGSIWKVNFWDVGISRNWLPNDTIILGVNDDWVTQGSSPNILINVNVNNYVTGNCIY